MRRCLLDCNSIFCCSHRAIAYQRAESPVPRQILSAYHDRYLADLSHSHRSLSPHTQSYINPPLGDSSMSPPLIPMKTRKEAKNKRTMAGPGGGPPRKSHTKSRNGCRTCKRRHIRCDETFPQWYICSLWSRDKTRALTVMVAKTAQNTTADATTWTSRLCAKRRPRARRVPIL